MYILGCFGCVIPNWVGFFWRLGRSSWWRGFETSCIPRLDRWLQSSATDTFARSASHLPTFRPPRSIRPKLPGMCLRDEESGRVQSMVGDVARVSDFLIFWKKNTCFFFRDFEILPTIFWIVSWAK